MITIKNIPRIPTSKKRTNRPIENKQYEQASHKRGNMSIEHEWDPNITSDQRNEIPLQT